MWPSAPRSPVTSLLHANSCFDSICTATTDLRSMRIVNLIFHDRSAIDTICRGISPAGRLLFLIGNVDVGLRLRIRLAETNIYFVTHSRVEHDTGNGYGRGETNIYHRTPVLFDLLSLSRWPDLRFLRSHPIAPCYDKA